MDVIWIEVQDDLEISSESAGKWLKFSILYNTQVVAYIPSLE